MTDGFKIEFSADPTFPIGATTELVITGGVTSYANNFWMDGSDCTTSNCNCACTSNTVYIGNHRPGDQVTGMIQGQGFAAYDLNLSCTALKGLRGNLTLHNTGYVRLSLSPAICGGGTNWAIRITCGYTTECSHFLQKPDSNSNRKRGVEEVDYVMLNTEKYSSQQITDVTIYPNPSSGEFHFTNTDEINYIEVYNTSGQVIMRKVGSIFSVDLSSYGPGIYLVKLHLDSGIRTEKVMVVD